MIDSDEDEPERGRGPMSVGSGGEGFEQFDDEEDKLS
jgi:hypothetical protein